MRWFRSLLTAIFFVFSGSRRRLRIWVQRASSTLKKTSFRFLHLNDNWFIFTCLAVFAPEGFLIPYLNSSSRENRLGKSSWISPDDDLMLNKLCFDNARFCHEVFASSYLLVAKISFSTSITFQHIFQKAHVTANKNAHIFQLPFSSTVFHALSHGRIHFVREC